MKKVSEIFGGAAFMLVIITAMLTDYLWTKHNGVAALFCLIGVAAVFTFVSVFAEKRSDEDANR